MHAGFPAVELSLPVDCMHRLHYLPKEDQLQQRFEAGVAIDRCHLMSEYDFVKNRQHKCFVLCQIGYFSVLDLMCVCYMRFAHDVQC